MPCQEKQHVSGTVRSTSAAQPSYVLAGPKASWERGENTSKATCPDTKKKTTTIIDTRIRVHTNVSQSAEVKPTFYRRPLDSGMHVLRRIGLASSSSSADDAIQLPVGLAGRPCWVKGHCCLVQACQAVAVDQVTTCRAPSKRQELVCWRKKVTLAACVRTARTV